MSGERKVAGVLADYLTELRQVVLLTADEERLHWSRYREAGDELSRLRLIEAYQPLVFKVVMKLRPPESLVMDMIQEGTIGLIEAVERFDHHRGVRFSTFATYRIRGRVLNSLRGTHRALGDLSLAADVADPVSDGALQSVEDAAMAHQVWQVLDALPERERAIVRATYLESREPRTVAAELRISLSHFYRLHKQALRHLRALVLDDVHRPGEAHGY